MIFQHTKKKFKAGDKVKLINGAQEITVLSYEGDLVQCTWYSEQEAVFKRIDAPETDLIKVS